MNKEQVNSCFNLVSSSALTIEPNNTHYPTDLTKATLSSDGKRLAVTIRLDRPSDEPNDLSQRIQAGDALNFTCNDGIFVSELNSNDNVEPFSPVAQ